MYNNLCRFCDLYYNKSRTERYAYKLEGLIGYGICRLKQNVAYYNNLSRDCMFFIEGDYAEWRVETRDKECDSMGCPVLAFGGLLSSIFDVSAVGYATLRNIMNRYIFVINYGISDRTGKKQKIRRTQHANYSFSRIHACILLDSPLFRLQWTNYNKYHPGMTTCMRLWGRISTGCPGCCNKSWNSGKPSQGICDCALHTVISPNL